MSRGDESRAQRFRQYQLVAWLRIGVGDDLLGMNDTGDRQAEFDLGVAHRVPADDNCPGRLTALGATAENLSEPVEILLVVGIAD